MKAEIERNAMGRMGISACFQLMFVNPSYVAAMRDICTKTKMINTIFPFFFILAAAETTINTAK